jgi:hypothetical protein
MNNVHRSGFLLVADGRWLTAEKGLPTPTPLPPTYIFDLTGIFADNLILSEINALQRLLMWKIYYLQIDDILCVWLSSSITVRYNILA